MKNIYLVFVSEIDGKYCATAETIRAGNNLIPFCKRYRAAIVHICETATHAHFLAERWNQSYRENGTYLYGEE